MAEVRYVNFYPDDWLAGTGALSIEERGVYITACAAIYSRGGPITRDHLRKLCPVQIRVFNRVLAKLLGLGKLYEHEDGTLDQKRCGTELKLARNRIETSVKNGQKGGRVSSKTNEIRKPGGSYARAGETRTTTTNNLKEAKEIDEHGRSAPSAEEVVYVENIVGLSVKRPGIRDPEAYGTAVDAKVRNTWLNNLCRYVSLNFKGQAQWDALQAIEDARVAGSREATPPHIRQLLDEIDKLERAERINSR